MDEKKFYFRVLFDQVGMPPAALAKILVVQHQGMTERSYQRMISYWLKTSSDRVPPDAAFDVLIKARKRQLQKAHIVISQAIENRDESGTTEIRLPYYTSQEDYDALYDDGYDWHMADVAMRVAAERLDGLGFDVMFAPAGTFSAGDK